MRDDRRYQRRQESDTPKVSRTYKVCPDKLATDGSKRRWERFIERVREKDTINGGISMLASLEEQPKRGPHKFESTGKNELRMAVLEQKDGKFSVVIVADNGNALSINYDIDDRIKAEGEARVQASYLGIKFTGFMVPPVEESTVPVETTGTSQPPQDKSQA